MKTNYMVVFERAVEDNWGAWVPDVQGAVGAGESRDDARTSVLEGVSIMLDDLKQRGLPFHDAVSMSVDFSEFDPDPASSHYEIEWLEVELPGSATDTVAPEHQAA